MMVEFMTMFASRHPLVMWGVMFGLLLGAPGGVALAIYRFRLIRDLRKRLSDAEARAQEYLDRIVALTMDASDVKDGHPYRTAAPKATSDVDETKGEKEKSDPADPRRDGQGRLRWRGEDEFICQACDSRICKDPIYHAAESDCPWKHKGAHVDVACGRCKAVTTYGMARNRVMYRSEVLQKKTDVVNAEAEANAE